MSNDISLDYKPGVDMNKKIFTNIVGSKSTHILLWTIDDYLVEDFFSKAIRQLSPSLSSSGGLRFTAGTGNSQVVLPRCYVDELPFPQNILQYSSSFEAYIYFIMRRDIALKIFRQVLEISGDLSVYEYANITEFFITLSSFCFENYEFDSGNIFQISSWRPGSLGTLAYSPSRDGLICQKPRLIQMMKRLKLCLTHNINLRIQDQNISVQLANQCIFNWLTLNPTAYKQIKDINSFQVSDHLRKKFLQI